MLNNNWFVVGDRVVMTEVMKRIQRVPVLGYPVTEHMLNKVYVVTETKVSSAKNGDFFDGVPHIKIDSDMNAFRDLWLDSGLFERAE